MYAGFGSSILCLTGLQLQLRATDFNSIISAIGYILEKLKQSKQIKDDFLKVFLAVGLFF